MVCSSGSLFSRSAGIDRLRHAHCLYYFASCAPHCNSLNGTRTLHRYSLYGNFCRLRHWLNRRRYRNILVTLWPLGHRAGYLHRRLGGRHPRDHFGLRSVTPARPHPAHARDSRNKIKWHGATDSAPQSCHLYLLKRADRSDLRLPPTLHHSWPRHTCGIFLPRNVHGNFGFQ